MGVEILEASVADLNPHKLRKTHQFGNIEYDPGKYYDETKKQQLGKVQSDTVNDHQQVDQQVDVDVDQDQVAMPSHQDELQAPWNQYAWIEELRLRVSVYVCVCVVLKQDIVIAIVISIVIVIAIVISIAPNKQINKQRANPLFLPCRLVDKYRSLLPWKNPRVWLTTCLETYTRYPFLPLVVFGSGPCPTL